MRDASEVTTRKLYEEDAYRSSFVAEIISAHIDGRKADLVLDSTAFFPEEGGQSPDHGSLGPYSVVDVRIRQGQIHHILDLGDCPAEEAEHTLAPGRMIEGSLDWKERFSNMQQHSGEHIFSGLAHRLFGVDNVGFHLSSREVTLDFNKVLTEAELQQVEMEANRAVSANVETEVIYPDLKEREAIDYRSKLDLPGRVRIVVFPGYDACACCAPHVKRSGEIGLIKLISVQKWKGGVRVNILCGDRAVAWMQKEHDAAQKTARYLSVGIEELFEATVRRQGDLEDQKGRIRSLEEKILLAHASALLQREGSGESSSAEKKPVLLFENGMDMNSVRSVINKIAAGSVTWCAVFMRKKENEWNYCIGSVSADTRDIQKKLREELGARGGGKPEMVQGSVAASEEDIRKIL